MHNGRPVPFKASGFQIRRPSFFSLGRVHERAGLFDDLGELSTSKSLFPSKVSTSSHGLFEFPLNASKPKTGIGVTSSESAFEIEQSGSSNAEQPTSGQSFEGDFCPGIWLSDGNETHQTGSFTSPTAYVQVKNVQGSPNLASGIATDAASLRTLPEPLNLFTKPGDLKMFRLPTRFIQALCSTSKKRTSLAERVEQRIPHSATPMTFKLNCAPSSLPQENNAMKDDVSLCTNTALTVQERLAVLEANDKAEHERRQSTFSNPYSTNNPSNNKSVIVGTCPDMCPETERYLRELRQRVSVFECLNCELSSAPWRMDHTRAVKDYSRSAADQAEPLPWELRPPEVLERTMNYLLSAIADRPEIDTTGNLWKPCPSLRNRHRYEFLWTRTRAIRKDITQQRLCSPAIVSIVEKITRFHIFCAARLVDQSMDAFDPRINSENLTQCLQTLKELYGDLRGAGADFSPCEAEFRAYMILMKLNDSSVLDEVQKFPDVLRKSKEVQFAIAVHSAVAEHNHVRFFRLVRMADCLTACLLHRYFSQVRSHALLALSSAFCGHPRHAVMVRYLTSSSLFSCDELLLSFGTSQLGFESRKDAQAFCEHWNLHVSGDDLIFRRHSPPREPEFAWQEGRALNLIEGKRLGRSLADLFNGGPIDPSYANPGPVHSSFDSEGRILSIQETQESPYCPSSTGLTPLPLSMDNLRSPPLSPDETNVGDAFSAHLRKPAFEVDFMTGDSSEPIFSDEAKSESLMVIFNEVLNCEIRSVALVELKETKAAASVADEMIDETIESCLTQVAEEEVAFRLDFVSSVTEEITRDIIWNFVDSSLQEIVFDIMSETVVSVISTDILREALSEFASLELKKARSEHLNMRRLLKRTFCSWKAIHQEQRQQNNISICDFLHSLPAAPAPHLWVDYFSEARLCGSRRTWLWAFPEKESHALKRARFSASNSTIDANLAYRPLDPIHDLSGEVRIGVIVSATDCFFSQWLCNKLKNLANFTVLSSLDHLTGKETGLIVVGDGLSHLEIPQLCLLPPDVREFTEQSDIMKSIAFPPLVYGDATIAYCWNSLLQTGLQWLVKKAAIVPGCKHSCGTKVETEKAVTFPHLFPQVSTLGEFVWSQVQATFLTPLLFLIEHWDKQGLTHPDPHHILMAYNQTLEPLPRPIRKSLVISPLPEPLPLTISWSEAANRWHTFLLTPQFSEDLATFCKLSPDYCKWWRRISALLIPWGPLCFRVVLARIDAALSDDERFASLNAAVGMVPAAVHALDRLSPQFSVASIMREFNFRRPRMQSSSNYRQPRRPPTPLNAMAQQLQELDAKIAKLSNDVRSILK
ncbi:unnamed protein product [Hydatigera taeniaeformis]|uniref:SAC3_GANP domain-containing protein n=1 Tax=Hydatigena taeniaeformis TaxID=6205 RepID=A0A0R3WK06_HYDTA|nr:unnamed protein product [Hydatigera taeniaeformis]